MYKSPSRPTLYKVEIDDVGNDVNDYLRFFCQATSIPGLAFDTLGVNGQEAQGIIRQQPYAVKYEKPFTITIIERTDYFVYNAMREWFDSVCPNANSSSVFSQRISFYNDILRDMRLYKQENGLNGGGESGYDVPLLVTFKNAFPTSIGAISLQSDARNTFTQFEVAFNYESYHTEKG